MLELYPYQREGVEWLKSRKRALLTFEMGLGKTATVIRAIQELDLKRLIIVCPPIARQTWKNEFAKWWKNHPTIRILEKRAQVIKDQDEIIICSFDYATAHFPNKLLRRFGLVVVDESHFLKSLEAKRTRAILGKDGLIHMAHRTFFLTGTPMPNHPGEIWPTLFCFGATTLQYDAFVKQYCVGYDFNGRWVINGTNRQNLPELREILSSVSLRRLAKDVLKDLPPIRYGELPLEAKMEKLTPQLQAEWDLLQAQIGALENASPEEAMEALSLVAGAVPTLRRYCAIQKVVPLSALITDELERNEYKKVVIFGVHREGLDSVVELLGKFNPVCIHGGISSANRIRAIEAFQNDEECRVFVGNIKAAGTNITLTAGDQVVFLEQSWVPGDNAQAVRRCARIGQKNSVFCRITALADTIDEKVQQILYRKSREIGLLVDGEANE